MERLLTDIVSQLEVLLANGIRAMIGRLAAAGYGLVNEIVEFIVEDRAVQVAYVHAPDGVIVTLLQEGTL